MKLISINLYEYTKPLKFSFQSAHLFRTQSESVLVRLEFDNGVVGYGESAPRFYVTGETISTVIQTVQEHFAPLLLGEDIDSLEDVERLLQVLENACQHRGVHHYLSSLGCFDIALLDALGKLHQIPLRRLIGPDIGRKVPLSIAIPFLPTKKIEALLPKIQHLKFQYIKALVGNDLVANEERISLIRSIFGEGMDLRIDANGKWDFGEAVKNLKKLKTYQISAVEQPLSKADIQGLKRLRNETRIPIIADESICSLSDAESLLENKSCDMFNIKISKCGGILRSKCIVDFAMSHNVPCQLGSHVGETQILTVAANHFLTTVGNLWCFEGLSFILFQGLEEMRQVQIKTNHLNTGSFRSGWGLGISPEYFLEKCDISPLKLYFSSNM